MLIVGLKPMSLIMRLMNVIGLSQIFKRSMGFEPRTTHQAKRLKESTNTNVPHMSLVK